MKRVYLDHNATTPLRDEARALWLEVQDEVGGNASSLHASGRRARARIDEARERVAGALGVSEEEVIFTSGGTESNNLALFGAAAALGPGSAVVTTAVEHSAVLEPVRQLHGKGHPGDVVGVDERGHVNGSRFDAALGDGPALVSVQAANNETGVVTPLAEWIPRLRERAAPLVVHTDAVQALGRLDLAPGVARADLASFSAHKVGGPVGVGVLVRRRGTPLEPRSFGGGQEHDQRPGTEDVAGIAAGALAIELAVNERETNAARLGALRDELWNDLTQVLPRLRRVAPQEDESARLPNTLCFLVPEADGKVLVTRLDLEGLEVSAGSACASGSLEPSHVLLALGHDERESRAALRLSLGRNTSRSECKRAVDILKKVFAPSHAT